MPLNNPSSGFAAGDIIPSGATPGAGWLLCYGQAISRADYSLLFTAIGTANGAGNGTTTFNVPDLRGRTIVGLDNMGGSAANRITSGGSGIAGTTLGAVGGTETHTLSTAQLASHTHSVPSGGAGTTVIDVTNPLYAQTNAAQTTGAQGSGNAHQNTQPSSVQNWKIKT